MKKLLVITVIGFNYCVGIYFGVLNTVYSLLLGLALFVVFRHLRRIKYSPYKEFSLSSETPPVTILIAMHNEEKVVLRSIRSALATEYPFFEVIIINDGSTDGTLQKVIDEFGLKKVDRVYRTFLKTKPARGFYYSPDTPDLLVIDKEQGGKADALNCGINVSRSPYFCSLDADSLLEKDALIRVMTPLID